MANSGSAIDALLRDEVLALLESHPLPAYLCDADGRIIHFNSLAAELWGRTPDLREPGERYSGAFRLYRPDGTPVAREESWTALALRKNYTIQNRDLLIERPDGDLRSVLVSVRPMHDAKSGLFAALTVCVDVTGRQIVDEPRNLLAAIVESSDDAIVAKTLDSKVMSWNSGAERLFGYTAAEMIGEPITKLIPAERQAEETLIISRLKRGERIENYETVRVTKDGRYVDVSLTVSPVRDETGRIVAASKIARDISLRKRANDAIIELKNQLQAQLEDLRRLHKMSTRLSTSLELQPILEETLRMAVAIAQGDYGLIALCRSRGETALRIGASLGFDDATLAVVTDNLNHCHVCHRCLAEQQRVIVDLASSGALRPDVEKQIDRTGIKSVHATPLLTRSGEILGVLLTYFRRQHQSTPRECDLLDLCARQAVDFIENALLYERLQETDRRKDEFLAMLAHELRNPLAPICNSLHILRMTEDLSPDVAVVRDVMDQQVNHMVRLVDDLLEVSRITSGKIELRKERIELAGVLSAAVTTSRPLIEAAGHRLAISIPHEPLILNADPVRLTQVVSNLLTNAAKYTEPGGQICLTVREQDGQAVVAIKDNGMGIPPEMLVYVFDMFAQVHRTLTCSQGGLGIGLTLSRKLTELHGGTLEAHSDGPGQGSEFVLTLPLVTDVVPLTMASTAPVTASEVQADWRILVVDDTRAAAYMLAKLLEHLGQNVTAVDSAAAAIDALQRSEFDVVLSDVAMPGMDGYELARRLRQEPRTAGLFLVALTGFGQESDRRRSFEAGFDHHIVKPVGVDQLRDLINSLPSRISTAGMGTSRPDSAG